MKIKKLCVNLSGVGALLICLPVIYRIYEGDRFNPASYFLWSALSLICTIALISRKEGGYMIMGGYILSDLAIGTYAWIKRGQASLGPFEWFIIGLTSVCACIYIWCRYKQNFKPAVIVNGIACFISGAPVVVETYEQPRQMSYTICGMYLLVSALAYYGEEKFSGKFIPGLSLIYWTIVISIMVILR